MAIICYSRLSHPRLTDPYLLLIVGVCTINVFSILSYYQTQHLQLIYFKVYDTLLYSPSSDYLLVRSSIHFYHQNFLNYGHSIMRPFKFDWWSNFKFRVEAKHLEFTTF